MATPASAACWPGCGRPPLGAFAHQELPFEQVVEELRPERDLARSPLFQVMFILQNNAQGPLELPGLTVEPYSFEATTAKLELTLSLFEYEGRMGGMLEHNTALFDGATAERLAGHFSRLLASALAAPDQPVGELPLLAETERHQLLAAWNDTAVSWPGETLIHELIAAEDPERQAVGFGDVGDHCLSYGELEARSNRLARHLRRIGVGPEVLVGLQVERSAEMVVALLGILKAGGAYVPLDPSHPAERLKMILEDSAVSVLLTDERLRLDEEAIARQSAKPLERIADAENLAYVLYTSGSTGRPKGVGLPHRAVVNFLRAMAERPGLRETDVVPAITTLSFDIAGLEIYLPLAVGARVEVLGREEAADGARLARRLAETAATVVQATPATWRLLIDSGWQGTPGLKVLCGGEALPRDLAEALLSRGVELWNVYGPTETAIWSAAGEVAPGEGPVLLGAPIANTRFYVVDRVDRGLAIVPVGVPGELWIAGDGVARGYLNRPDLTAERFTPDPFGPAGARLYRTGDLVRYRPSGELEFLGRIDHQVKVRGFRIELGEIEATLSRHPAVRQAIVIVRDERLVGYLVAETVPGDLRDHLRRLLPEYMIPSAFVALESLPLTPSGKVDRKALPDPGTGIGGDGYVAPQTPVEEILAGIWAEILRAGRVGTRDNFFDLGGHSLLATQVVSRIRTALGVELPLQRLFEAPTVAGLAKAIAGARAVAAPPIVPVPREGGLPLSFAQERMWFLHQLEPRSSAYNLAAGVRLEGDLDPAVLARCFTELVRRHETLRTTFAEVDGKPVQVIHPPAQFELPVFADTETDLESVVQAESARPFDLAKGPLLRATLVKTGEREHALLVVMHHIGSDGWSMALLLGELTELYKGSLLPDLPVQYADFAAWQRQWLAGEELERQVAYWKEELAGAPPLLELPLDRPRPAVQSFRGGRHRLSLSADLTPFARREGLTPFMVFMAAFQALLGRYTAQGDVVVGTPIANRTRTEVERLIGFFANTLVFRSSLGDDPTFVELARRVRTSALGAYDHQDLPFEKLVDELDPERHLSYPPLFQVMFILQNAPAPEVDLAGLKMLPLQADRGQSPFDLTLVLMEVGGRWIGSFEYVADLFDASTMARWAGHLQTLLGGIAEDPARPVSELPLLSEAERQELLSGWNDTAVAWPDGTLIHELIAKDSDRWAVGFGGERLSYGDLEARSNRLARHLRRIGIGPEVLVGLQVERSAEMVVALLGILKAGGAYVPLDPSHPEERLRMILEDSAVSLLLTDERLRLDEEAIARESAAPLERLADAESLAYVLYTSGSTGRPKGVGLPHRAVVNFLRAMAGRPGLGADDVVPAITTLSFDIAGLEIYLPLAVGARVEVLGREEASDGARLARRLADIGATVVQATPATWRLLIDSGWRGTPGLEVLCGGEALPRDLAEALLSHGVELWNVYGPTETAIWSAAGEVESGDGPVLLGLPIANTRFYVVDRRFEIVPQGIPGELWIAGGGVARGYLNRPDLTAERFTPDPFGPAGERLYRTGDLVRYRPSGELEFLGRIDHQVKVRGFRIELGEIETALSRHPGVRQAVVVVRDESLVAYLVGNFVAEAVPGGLREHLRKLLPDYMIPSAFMVLEALPLTPSGKVDRKALPAPEAATAGEGYVAPQGPVEELLAGIWAEVLRVGRVGARDNFFELGGHSLLATQVVSRIRTALGLELPLQRLFEAPTVAGLARFVTGARAGAVPPIVPVPREGRLALSFAQERMWFLHQLEPQSSAYNLAAGVRLEGDLDPAVLARCFTELVRRHETLRTTFAEVDGKPVQVIHPPSDFSLPLIETDLASFIAAESSRPFDLAEGPLLRATLVKTGEREHALLVVLHHVVSDGWSMALLLGELMELYKGSPLPELPVQYADFAVWQRQWLAGEELKRQVSYWKEQLAGAPLLLGLPLDRPRPAVQSFRGGRHRLSLSTDLTPFARREGLTPFMVLLAAFQALLGRYTGQGDVVVGTPIANRTRTEVEHLIGFFANTLVFRSSLADDPSFVELARQVRASALGAYDHQDLPFERLVDELDPERHLSYPPVFQVMFILQNAPAPEVDLAGLKMLPLQADRGQSPFDLTLVLVEAGGRWMGSFEYAADLFDASTMARWAGHLETLLGGIAEDPTRPVSELPLLAEAERQELLSGWNDTAVAWPDGMLIHELIAKDSDRWAVGFGSERLSYGELEARSNRLARHLRRIGVGPEVLVGLQVERSAEMVVALLGILKAGGAYVPLDPSHPAERLKMILEDSAVSVLLTDERLRQDAEAIAGESAAPLARIADAENLAYVLYTSGSTGRPKGVGLPHRAVVNFLRAMAGRPGLGADDVVPALTTLSFDIAGLEIYLPLAVGARVEVLGSEEVWDGVRLAGRLAEIGATVVQATPATWRLLIASGWQGTPGLKVLCGGEALPRDLAEALLSRGVELWNVYGPTETAIWSAAGEVTSGGDPVLLGAPIANTRFYVVDQAFGIVPQGIPGELWIAGGGVSRGYLNRPDLTAERFTPDPFGPAGARLYRTGDLVRYRPSGERVPGPHRPPGQGPGLPYRAGRDRSRALSPSRGAAGRRHGPGRAPRGLRGGGGRAGRPARAPAEAPAGLHDPVGIRGPGVVAADAQRQGGPQGPPRARDGDRRRGLRGSRGTRRGAAGRDLGRDPAGRSRGRPEQLFRARRPLAARHPGRLPHPHGPGRGAASATPVRGSHRGRPCPCRHGSPRGGGSPHGARAARRRPPALLRPGADVVPPPARAALVRLQPGERRAADRGSRSGRAGTLLQRVGAAARDPEDHLRGGGRPAGAGDPSSSGIRASGSRGGLGELPRRGEPPSVRPRPGTAASSQAGEDGRARARSHPGDAPHHLGRLVHGPAPERADGAVQRLRRGPSRRPAGAAGAVRGLRGLAAELARGRGAGTAGGLLEGAARRGTAAAGAASGPSSPGRAELPGWAPPAEPAGGPHALAGGLRAARGADAVHGSHGGVPGPPGPLHLARRRGGGHAHRQPHPDRGRAPHRLLRQHPGLPRRPVGRPCLRGLGPAGARFGPGGLRPPGPAV